MLPTPEMTFIAPAPKRDPEKPLDPYRFMKRTADAYRARQKLDYLEEQDVLRRMAEQEARSRWASLSVIQRKFLGFFGYTEETFGRMK